MLKKSFTRKKSRRR